MNPHTTSLFLPPELKKILYEVARTGKCNSLPWTASDIRSFKRGTCSSKRRRRQQQNQQQNSANEIIKRTPRYLQQPSHLEEDPSASIMNAKLVMGQGCSSLDDHSSSAKSCVSKVSKGSSKCSAVDRTEAKGTLEEEEDEDELSEKEYEDESVRAADRKKRRKHSSIGASHPVDGGNGMVVVGTQEDAGSLASVCSSNSVGLNTKNSDRDKNEAVVASLEKKRVRRGGLYYHSRDQSCASSSCCSESVSSTGGGSTISVPSSLASMGPLGISLPFRTLRGALRLAVALVLEYSYKNRGGYKLSPAEKRRFQIFQKQQNPHTQQLQQQQQQHQQHHPTSFMDIAFMERRIRLLKMLGGGKSAARSTSSVTRVMSGGSASDGGFTSDTSFESVMRKNSGSGGKEFVATTVAVAAPSRVNDSGPPFTIQRVAEVLLMPERYYGQTHKLCNALEKLLLVTSPSTAFGGIMGGDALPPYRRGDEREMIASLGTERKEREESSEYMHSSGQLKRRISFSSSSLSDGCDPIIQMNVSVETCDSARKKALSNDANQVEGVMMDEEHDDSHGHLHVNRISQSKDYRADQKEEFSTREDTVSSSSMDHVVSSPLQGNGHLPSLETSFTQSSTTKNGNRPQSPSLYSPHNSFNNLIRNSHKSATMQGQNRKITDPNSLISSRQNVQMEILIDPTTDGNHTNHLPVQNSVNASDVAFLENISGRSSASNSDIDSESDDISFDDSASDRSDGSDFDTGAMASLPEPFTAARVMALNRMQQQHRREQYLQDRALRQQVAIFQSPPPDSEYQSGDSIDSGLAEDSCGSDSSSSDFTD